MHYSSWLASTILLTVPVTAFYPYDPNHGSAEAARTKTPSASGSGLRSLHSQPFTVDIKKQQIKSKRENDYPIPKPAKTTLPNAAGVSQDANDHSYVASIQIGSKGKTMWMLIDSGSANTWVFGSNCTSQACREHETFGKDDSDTLETTSTSWKVKYGSGDVSGVVAEDKFSFAGYNIELGFGLAREASEDFTTYPMDGILGLGRDSSNKLKTPTFMEVMAKENLLEANMFGIHLSRTADGVIDGQITFGTADKSRFSGDISYTDSITNEGLWEIPAGGVAVDGQDLGLEGKTAIIDTGTSYIILPRDDAKVLHSKIPGSSDQGEEFTIPCDSRLPIQFTISEITYEVPSKDYVGEPEEGGDQCASKILGHQTSFGPDAWLLGDVFLKNVYTVFDFDGHRVGFGTMSGAEEDVAASSSEAPSRSQPTKSSTNTSKTGTGPFSVTTAGDATPLSTTSLASELGATEEDPEDQTEGNTAGSLTSSFTVTYPLSIAVAFVILFI